MDALTPYRFSIDEFDDEGEVEFTHETEEHGFRQIEALRKRLTHFNQHAHPYLKGQMRQRGPDPKRTLPMVCGELAKLYKRITGKDLTHNPNNKNVYTGSPQSEAGQFIAAFLKLVDPKLPPSRISSTLVDFVKKSKRQD